MNNKKSNSALINTLTAEAQNLIIDTKGLDAVSVQVTYTASAPSAKAFTAAVTDICTAAAHGFVTGLKVRGTTTTTLPAGLSLATDYFVIKLDADTFKLATSLANATAGTAVDITNTGTGTHTLTATTAAGNVTKLQVSNDGTNYADLGSYTVTQTTSNVTTVWEVGRVYSRYLRVNHTPSAGQATLLVAVAQTPIR